MINDKLDIVGAEALIRWDDPEVGSVSPADFIPLSEKNGLIYEITRIVIHTIIQQLEATSSRLEKEAIVKTAIDKGVREFFIGAQYALNALMRELEYLN